MSKTKTMSFEELRASVADVPEPFRTEWEERDGYLVWIAAFHAPDGGIFMHRLIGATRESFEIPWFAEHHMLEAKRHFKREVFARHEGTMRVRGTIQDTA